jgi:hypothetical protein
MLPTRRLFLKKLKRIHANTDILDMMITKNSLYSHLSVAFSLTLAACAHSTVKNDSQPIGPVSQAAVNSFVERAVASAPGESALVAKVAQALMGTSDETVFLTEAKRFLSTDERLTASNVAGKFTEEQGLAFLKELKTHNSAMFRTGAMEQIANRIDSAIIERAASGNLEGHSNLTGGMSLTDTPALVTAVRRAGQISPPIRSNVVEIFQNTGYQAINGSTCTTVAHFSTSSLSNTVKFYNELATVSRRISSTARNRTACMVKNTAVAAVLFTSTVTHAPAPFVAAENLSEHCNIPPGIKQEVARLEEDFQRTGRMPEYDYSCSGI